MRPFATDSVLNAFWDELEYRVTRELLRIPRARALGLFGDPERIEEEFR